MTEFDKIIDIRNRKVRQNRKAEKAAMAECNSARERVQKAHQAIEEFAEEIRTLEVDLLNELLETRITVLDVDELNRKLADAERKAKRLKEIYDGALAALAQAEQELESRRRERAIAQSKLSKIEELNLVLVEENNEASRALEDAQIDEFVETMRFAGGQF